MADYRPLAEGGIKKSCRAVFQDRGGSHSRIFYLCTNDFGPSLIWASAETLENRAQLR